MTTARQQLKQAVITRLNDRRSNPAADSQQMSEFVEEVARENNRTWDYYMSASDKQYFKLAHEIEKEVSQATAHKEEKANEKIGKRVHLEESFDPATKETHAASDGEVVQVDATGYLFQIRRDSDGSLAWADSRMIIEVEKKSEPKAEEPAKYLPAVEAILTDLRERLDSEEKIRAQSAFNSKQRIFHAGRKNLLEEIIKSITDDYGFFNEEEKLRRAACFKSSSRNWWK